MEPSLQLTSAEQYRQTTWTKSPRATVLLLAPFMILGAAGMDIYLPSVMDLQENLAAPSHLVQLTLTLYVLFSGLGQLAFGPMADVYGRRPVLLGGLAFYAIAALGCATTSNIYIMIGARVLQSAAASAAAVATMAIVRDGFSGLELAKVYSRLNSVLALAPIAAPVLGGLLSEKFGWRSGFYLLTAVSIVELGYAILCVPESKAKEPQDTSRQRLLVDYGIIARHRSMVVYGVAMGAGLAGFFGFFSVAPILVMQVLGSSKLTFSALFGAVASIYMVASFKTPILIEKAGVARSVLVGNTLLAAGGALMVLSSLVGHLSLAGLALPMGISMVGIGLIIGAASAGAMESFANRAGRAAAIMAVYQFSLGALIGSLPSALVTIRDTAPLGWMLIGAGGASALLLVVFGQHADLQQGHTRNLKSLG